MRKSRSSWNTSLKKTWFSSSVWKPQDISAYQRLVRTNNDLEGYHRRLNARINKDNPSLFSLLEVLYKESQLVNLTAKLVTSNTVKMQRQRKTQERQGKLEDLWSEYDSGTLPNAHGRISLASGNLNLGSQLGRHRDVTNIFIIFITCNNKISRILLTTSIF